MAPLTVELRLSKKDLTSNVEGARLDMQRFERQVSATNAELLATKRAAREAGGGTAEQVARIKELKSALDEANKSLRTARTEYTAFSAESGNGGGVQFASGKRLRKGAMAVEGAAFGAAGGGDATGSLISGAQGAAMAFQLGTGPMIAVAALGMLAVKLHESQKEAKALQKELDDLGLPLAGGKSASIEAITARLSAAAETTKKLEAAQASFLHVAGGTLGNAGHTGLNLADLLGPLVSFGKDLYDGYGKQQKGDEEAIRRAREERDRYTGMVASHEEDNNKVTRRENAGDDRAAIERIRQKYREEAATLDDKHVKSEVGDKDFGRLKAALQEKESLEVAAEERRQAGIKRAADLEKEVVAIKRDGYDVEERTAQARRAGAQKALSDPNAPKEGVEREKLVTAVSSAQGEVEAAARNRKAGLIDEDARKQETAARAADDDGEVVRARRALDTARRKRDTTLDGSDERRKADESVGTAEVDLRDAGRREQAGVRAVALEERIVAIKRSGLNVEVEIARARLEAAEAALQNGPRQGVGHDQLAAAASAAKLEVETAEKATSEKRNQAYLEERIASLRGSSDQVHRATLAAEREDIERRMVVAKNDEMLGLLVERARNQQKQDAASASERTRAVDRQGELDKALHGRGPQSESAYLNREMGRDLQRLALNNTDNGGDEDAAAKIVAHYSELKKTLEQINQQEKDRLLTIGQQTTAIEQQGFTLTLPQKKQGIAAHYQQQIDDAKFSGNDPLAAALAHQRDAALESAAVDEEMMTPAQKARRARDNQRRERAQARVRSRNGTGMTKAREATGNRHSMTFGELIDAGRPILGVGRPNPAAMMPKPNVGHEALKTGIAGTNQRLDRLIENCTFKGK